MSKYISTVTNSLTNLISEISENPSLFVRNPKTDFTRNRKINFKTFIGITTNSGGGTMNKELLDYFDFNANTPTVSAYTQQRSKVLPEVFEFLFKSFTKENLTCENNYKGYRLVACDGSNLTHDCGHVMRSKSRVIICQNDLAFLWMRHDTSFEVIAYCPYRSTAKVLMHADMAPDKGVHLHIQTRLFMIY